MKVNWKHLSTTEGYISLKKAYIKSVHTANSRHKAELLSEFNWVINRAKHYTHVQGRSIENVLSFWEAKRTYCWRNYYQNCVQPKLRGSNNLKRQGINGYRKSLKKWNHNTPQETKNRVCREIQRIHRNTSTKLKPRWTPKQKENFAKYGR